MGQAFLVRSEESLPWKRKFEGDMLWLAENGSLVNWDDWSQALRGWIRAH